MTTPIRSLDRALDILCCFTQEEHSLSLTQISDLVNLPKSTTYRMLSSLEGKRFLNRDNLTGKYHLGYQFIDMANIALQDIDIQNWALPFLEKLSADCGETVDLAVLDQNQVIYIGVVESKQRVKIAASVGQRLPAFCTASGKAFLAFLSDSQVTSILNKGMPVYTPTTPRLKEKLFTDLRMTRERGYAISEQEYETDINAVAVPILDRSMRPILAMSAVGPAYRFSNERMVALVGSIRSVNEAIVNEIGIPALKAIVSKIVNSGFSI
ncbi:MAG TPA: IclR family transcriptional regulator [Longilinea sp.]|nr:IclR family transcriptional regulator [Longilinea sp.]